MLFNDNAMNMLSGLRNIGSGDQPKATGGIFLPSKSLVGDFDHAVVVRLKAHGGKTAVNDLLGQLLKAHSATDAPTTAHENVGNHGTSPAAPPIIVGEDAASEQ